MNLFQKTPAPVLGPMPAVPWASGAVFNPGAWFDGERVHLVFRAIPAGYERIPLAEPDPDGPDTGFTGYVSYLGYASSADGLHFEVREEPFLKPDADYDRFGVEDARISHLEGRYWLTYTALSRDAFDPVDGVRIGLASTTDFQRVEKHGVVGPPRRDKDAVLFPRRFGRRVALLHRISPDVQIIFFDDLEQFLHPPEALWADHLAHLDRHVLLRPVAPWERKKVGAGPTPVETPEGWLLLYHGVDADHVYRGGLALLDLDDPRRVVARLDRPVLEPELPFEREGDVNNVVFPEGAVVIGSDLHVYYGAADRVVGHARAPLADVLDLLLREGRR